MGRVERKRQTKWILWFVGGIVLLVLCFVGYGFYREARLKNIPNEEVTAKAEVVLRKGFIDGGDPVAFASITSIRVDEKGKMEEVSRCQPVIIAVSGILLRKYSNGEYRQIPYKDVKLNFYAYGDGFGHVARVELKRN